MHVALEPGKSAFALSACMRVESLQEKPLAVDFRIRNASNTDVGSPAVQAISSHNDPDGQWTCKQSGPIEVDSTDDPQKFFISIRVPEPGHGTAWIDNVQIVQLEPDGQGGWTPIADPSFDLQYERERLVTRYAAFGERRGPAATAPAPAGRGFGSHPVEGASGLVAMGARHYDPTTGSFLQPDPLGLAADATYAYAAGAPYRNWDPSGLVPRSLSADTKPIAAPVFRPEASPTSRLGRALRLLGRGVSALPLLLQGGDPTLDGGDPNRKRPTAEVIFDTNLFVGTSPDGGSPRALKTAFDALQPNQSPVITSTIVDEVLDVGSRPGRTISPEFFRALEGRSRVQLVPDVPNANDSTVLGLLFLQYGRRNDPGTDSDIRIGATALATGRPVFSRDITFIVVLQRAGSHRSRLIR